MGAKSKKIKDNNPIISEVFVDKLDKVIQDERNPFIHTYYFIGWEMKQAFHLLVFMKKEGLKRIYLLIKLDRTI